MPTRDVSVRPSIRKDSQLFLELCEALLRRGLPVQFTVHGQSMQPNLLDGDTVLVEPAAPGQLRRGDIALMQTSQGICVHRVNHISGSKITTSGDAGLENDPDPLRVLGKIVSRSRDSREQSFNIWRTRLTHPFFSFYRRLRAAAAIRFRRATSLVTGALGLLFLLAAIFAPAASAQTLTITNTAAPTPNVAPGNTITYTQVMSSGNAAINPNIVVQHNFTVHAQPARPGQRAGRL